MANRTWIKDSKYDIVPQDPTEIEDDTVDEVIECTGWWMAGDFDTAQWVEDKGVGDDEYYITQWNDSSGNENHLVDEQTASGSAVGQGPRAYGGGTNEHGSVSDEVGNATETFPVAQFEDIGAGNGEEQGPLFLKCTPSVAMDFVFTYTGSTSVLTFIAVCRHHYAPGDLENGYLFQAKDMGTVAMSFDGAEGASWSVGFSEGMTTGGVDLENTKGTLSCAKGWSNDYMNLYNTPHLNEVRDVENEYGILNFWQAASGTDPHYLDISMCSFQGTSYHYTSEMQNIGFGANEIGDDDGKMYIGLNTRTPGSFTGFEGRIVEMACWKSDNPISVYKRAQVLEYFKDKFSNDI